MTRITTTAQSKDEVTDDFEGVETLVRLLEGGDITEPLTGTVPGRTKAEVLEIGGAN